MGKRISPLVALLLAAYLIGALAIFALATRRDQTGLRRGATWPRRRFAKASAAVLAVLVITYWNLSLQARLEVQELRTEAGAIWASVAPPRVADSANAALLYAQAVEQMKVSALPDDKDREFADLEPRSPEVAAYLQRQQKALDLARHAADRPDCRFDHDYSRPNMDAMLGELGALRQCSRLLRVAAQSQAASGDPKLALADWRRMHAVGAHAVSSPGLMGGLVALAIDASASKTAPTLFENVHTRAQLDEITPLDSHAPVRQYNLALQGEEAFGLASFCDMANGKFSEAPTTWSRAAGEFLWLVWMQDEVPSYREFLAQVRDFSQRPYFERKAQIAALQSASQTGPPAGIMLQILTPSILRSLAILAETQALASAVDVAHAATRYRLDHGEYPASAQALAPEYILALPLDPFDGHPLRWTKRRDGSVVIYSLGADGTDDGGQVEPDQHARKAPDIGIVLKPPPK